MQSPFSYIRLEVRVVEILDILLKQQFGRVIGSQSTVGILENHVWNKVR